MNRAAQELHPLEEQAINLLLEAAHIKYGSIQVEIQVKDGRRARASLAVTKTTVEAGSC